MAHYTWFVRALHNGAWERKWGWFHTREDAEYLVRLFWDELMEECAPDQQGPGTNVIVIDRTIRFRSRSLPPGPWYDA